MGSCSLFVHFPTFYIFSVFKDDQHAEFAASAQVIEKPIEVARPLISLN